jgi:hypothetical protein
MTNEKWCRLAERKQELAELKIQQLRQEHEQKKRSTWANAQTFGGRTCAKVRIQPRNTFIKIKIPPGGARNKTEAIAGEINCIIY